VQAWLCDEHWLISTEERADIARDLKRAGKRDLTRDLPDSPPETGRSTSAAANGPLTLGRPW
jgi:hypothetical protein